MRVPPLRNAPRDKDPTAPTPDGLGFRVYSNYSGIPFHIGVMPRGWKSLGIPGSQFQVPIRV